MGFATPLGLLALLSIPAVLALHLFRRRFRRRRVAGLFLFAPDALVTQAGRTRTRLLRTASLWLELLAGLLLALWLGGLFFGDRAGPEHLVIVLDDSASMAARGDDGVTSDRVREWVREALDDLPYDGVATLVVTGPRPEILAGPRAPKGLAAASLDEWRPSRIGHDPTPALELGLDLAADGDPLCFLTDRETPRALERYRHVALGEAVGNVAIISARRVERESVERIFADLMAWGVEPVTTRVVLEMGPEGNAFEAGEREVMVTPGRTLHLAWSVMTTGLPVRVRLSEDALDADNETVLLPTPRRILPVHVALDEARVLALRLGRVLSVLPRLKVVSDPAAARLVFTNEPGVAGAGATEIVVDAPGEKRDDWVGPFLMERRRALGGGMGSALLSGVSLEGVIWSASPEEAPGLALILAGEVTLLGEESTSGGGVRLHLNLDPERSNLCSSPDWPILLSNLTEQVRDTLPGPVSTNVRVGEEMAYRFEGSPDVAATLALVDPAGGRRPARGWRMLAWEARRKGIYRLVDPSGDLAHYAVSFVDPAESDLTVRGECDEAAVEVPAVAAAVADEAGRPEGRVLALLLLLAVAADWFVLRRQP
jgi:hypothetical protein